MNSLTIPSTILPPFPQIPILGAICGLMPNINLTDERLRDAVVKAESTTVREASRYRGPKGKHCSTRKVLKATIDQDYDTLRKKFETNEKLGEALIAGDPDIDLERNGMFLWDVSRVYINPKEELVYRIRQDEKILNPDGSVRETRNRRRLEPNVDADIPLTWSGKFIEKEEAIRKFVFKSKLQIVHVNGLTYDFLFGMAKDLHERKSMMILGAGKNGTKPLVFRRGSTPYRAFLEGRVKKDQYILLLHLSNLELKRPQAKKKEPLEEKNL